MKLTFNSPFVLFFSAIAVTFFVLQIFLGAPLRITVLKGTFDYSSFQDYISLLGYSFGHANTAHLIGNFSIILLIGPTLEKALGFKRLFIYTAITSLVIAIFHILFFDTGLMGASGIVFMMIVLISLNGRKSGELPLTFLLIILLFIGQEVLALFQKDQVSQFAHILGGAMGLLLGYFRN
jgi:membrane associated rhomboid family serine protease